MALLEELKPGVMVNGLPPGSTVTLIRVQRHDSIGVELVYISRPFHHEPDFGATSANYDLEKPRDKGVIPV